jgi:hypothetical protein
VYEKQRGSLRFAIGFSSDQLYFHRFCVRERMLLFIGSRLDVRADARSDITQFGDPMRL